MHRVYLERAAERELRILSPRLWSKMGIFEFDPAEIAPNTETQQWEPPFPDFYDNLLFGYFFKDIVIVLLDKSGYEVYPFGYESVFPTLKRQIYGFTSSDVMQKVRSAPDLLVRNPSDQRVEFVEVKARSHTGKYRKLDIETMKEYRQFWPESIIALVVSGSNYFYAQRVAELPSTGTKYDIDDFRPIEEIFPLVESLSEDFKRKMVRIAATLFCNRDFANL